MVMTRIVIVILGMVCGALILYRCAIQPVAASSEQPVTIPPAHLTDDDFVLSNILRIDKNGDVYINWSRAEAFSNGCPHYSTTQCAITRAIMSVRDDSWNPLP